MALGRCGAREMTLTSDLDLIFIYHRPDHAMSSGPKSIDGHQYFSRFGQELINALSSLTAEGRCYEVDMRLRPSGNSGPVAVHIDSFMQYHHHDAWLWEHLALVKSRVIGGISADPLSASIDAISNDWIKSAHDAKRLTADTQAMREKLLTAQPAASPRDIRRIEGGIMDIDLLTAMMQLHPDAKTLPRQLQSSDAAMILAEHGLITKTEADTITKAVVFYSDLIQWIRLAKLPITSVQDTNMPPPNAPLSNASLPNAPLPNAPLPNSMAKHFKVQDIQGLDLKIQTVAETILPLMKKYVCKT